MKCVGMQVITESLAMGTFKSMKENTRDELLRNVVELTAQDEARHVSYGLIYMKEELPRMSDPDRERVEDFALTAVRCSRRVAEIQRIPVVAASSRRASGLQRGRHRLRRSDGGDRGEGERSRVRQLGTPDVRRPRGPAAPARRSRHRSRRSRVSRAGLRRLKGQASGRSSCASIGHG